MPNKCEYSQLKYIAKLIKTPIFKDTRKIDTIIAPKGTHIKVLREFSDSYEICVSATFGEKNIRNAQLGDHGIILKENIKNHWKAI